MMCYGWRPNPSYPGSEPCGAEAAVAPVKSNWWWYAAAAAAALMLLGGKKKKGRR